MNFKKSYREIQDGYQMIFDDAEEKFVYIALNGGATREIPRNKLIELIQSGKPMPVIEIIEKAERLPNRQMISNQTEFLPALMIPNEQRIISFS